jgi:CO dehydrogenase maturation factor
LLGLAEQYEGVVVADFEAGLGTLMRMRESVDEIVVVAEPTVKSMEVARRAVAYARERELGRVWVLANRVRDEEDERRVREVLGEMTWVVPEDEAVVAAERQGVGVVDGASAGPAVAAIQRLAAALMPSVAPA